MHKFQIKSIVGELMTVEVLEGNKIVLTKEIPVTLNLKLDKVRNELAGELALIENQKNRDEQLKLKVEKLKLQVGKKLDL